MAAIRLGAEKIFSKIKITNLHQLCGYSTSKTAIGGWSHVDKVVTTSDNSTFVAWHPIREFPYELSKPIPPKAIPSSSLVKEEALATAMSAFERKHPEIVRQELSRVTYTTKHRWFPRSRDRKAKKTPMDREYL